MSPLRGREVWIPWALALLAGGVSWIVRRQGLDLLEDGLWLLAADTLRQGGTLYRELVLRDGPLDAGLLWACFGLFGHSAAALALLKCAVDGAAAALAYLAGRRLGAGAHSLWAALGAVVLGPFAPRTVLALGAALLAARRRDGGGSPAQDLALGFLLGLCALGGLDGIAFAAVLGAVALTRIGERRRRGAGSNALAYPLFGFAFPWLVVLAAGAMRSALPAAFDQVGLAGLERLGDQLRAVPGWGWLRLALGAGAPTSPFTGLATGETLNGFLPAHGNLRALSFQLRVLALIPVLVLAWMRKDWRRGAPLPLLAFATLPAITLLLRGHASFVDRAWIGALFLLPALLNRVPRTGLRRASMVALPLLLWGLPALEFGWLAAHPGREGLQTWERPTARIALAHSRIEQIETLFEALGPGREALVIWPASPGLHFLMERPPALAQTVLLEQRVRHGERLVEQLEARAPLHVLLSLSWHFGGKQIEALAPGVWDRLRHDYWVFGNLAEGGLRMRVLERVPEGESLDEVPLPQRLPQIEQTVANGTGPAMRKGLEVGQSFEVGDSDLAGFAVRWSTKARDLEVPVRIRIWSFRNGHWGNLVLLEDLVLQIPGDLHRSYIRMGPVRDTAGQRLAVTLELAEDIEYDLRLLWHRRDTDPEARDFYEDGSAMLEMDPVNADLYFLTW